MSRLIMLLALPPVLRGFVALLVSGACFPLCGVMVLRLNLVPLRYMLMHGVILGGAVSLAATLPLLPVTILINVLLVLAIVLPAKNGGYGFGGTSAAAMVLSMAVASLITHLADVPAKDTLGLLWGSPFALSNGDVVLLCLLAAVLVLYIAVNFRTLAALFFSQDIAFSLGLRVRFHYTIMVLLIALVVAVAMKLLGAFLIDALLILPVLAASSFLRKRQSLQRLFVASGVAGLAFSFAGYLAAVLLNLPPGAAIACVAGIVYGIGVATSGRKTT